MHKLIALFSGAILLALSFNPAIAGQVNFLAIGPSAGTASAQTLNNVPNIVSMSDLTGTNVAWIVGAGLTDTGPTTMSINGLPAVPVDRMNSGTHMPLGGGEMPAGEMVRAYFDGTELILETDFTGPDPVGSSKIINYTTPDPGYVLENGQCLSQTAEPALFGKYGTQYNTQDSCPTGQFGVDNKAGRTMAAADSMTVSGSAAGILNNCASTIGATCGIQSSVIAKANLASFTMTGSGSGSGSGSISGTASGSMAVTINWPSGNLYVSPNQNGLAGGSADAPVYCPCANLQGVGGTASGSLGVSGSASVSVSTSDSINSGGSATPLTNVQPTKIVYYEAKL